MADLDFTAGVKSDGSDAQLAASISASLTKAFNKLGPQLSKMLAKDFANIFSGGKANDIFEGAIKGAKAFDREIQTVSDRLDALYSGGRGQRKAFPGLDPRSLDAVESSLEQIIRLQADIAKGGGSGGKSGGKDGILARAAQAELTAVRVLAQQATLAIREANNASARDTNQVSRERTAVLRAENGRAVAELQTRSAREVALLRTSAQQQIATTQATAKSRAATFALVATAVRSSERVIRSTFENTARVVSASLNGITRTASSVASGLGNAFRSANR